MVKLQRKLGLAECIFFGVGSILGAGIYTLIGKVAGLSGNFIWLSFLIASIAALFTAFSYAELSSLFPKAGGEYVYVKKAFGKKVGTILGIILSLNGIIGGSAVALGFAGYLFTLLHINLFMGSVGILVLIFLVNASGIKQSSTLNIVFTLIEAGGLFIMIFFSFSSIGKVNFMELPPSGFNGIMSASALSFFAYMGFEEIVKLAEETRDPEKNIPKALLISSIIVIVIYGLVSICAVSVMSFQELGESKSPISDIVSVSIGQTGVLIITIVALFATSNTILSNMLGSSRVLLHMAREQNRFKMFSVISVKHGTPIAVLLVILTIMCGLVAIGEIEFIARIATICVFSVFVIVNLSVIVLRFKENTLVRPYRIPFNIGNIPVMSVLGIMMTIVLLVYTFYALFEK